MDKPILCSDTRTTFLLRFASHQVFDNCSGGFWCCLSSNGEDNKTHCTSQCSKALPEYSWKDVHEKDGTNIIWGHGRFVPVPVNNQTASPEALIIEVGRLKLMPPRGDDTAINQIPQSSISTCIEECKGENGKVFLIPSKLNLGNVRRNSAVTLNMTVNVTMTMVPHDTPELPQKLKNPKLWCHSSKAILFFPFSSGGWGRVKPIPIYILIFLGSLFTGRHISRQCSCLPLGNTSIIWVYLDSFYSGRFSHRHDSHTRVELS